MVAAVVQAGTGRPGHDDLVGRDNEKQALRDALTDAVQGRGRLVLVGGEAGIGKTALVEHFASEARALGATVLSGACYDADSSPPYAPWSDALGAHGHSSRGDSRRPLWFDEEHLTSLSDQRALFGEVRQRIIDASSDKPMVLILEDLHWADRESLELLRFVGRSLSPSRVLIAGTYRSDEVGPASPLYSLLPDLVREAQSERLDLRRFAEDTVRELVVERYGLPPRERDRLVADLMRRTDGNPFFIVEVLRSLEIANVLSLHDVGWALGSLTETEVPLLIRQVIDRRFLQLDEAARLALQIASVIGYEIDTDVWHAVSGQDDAGLAEIVQQALDTHLLEQSPHSAQLRFRHAIVRETLYASLPLPWRKLRHRRIAEVLAELPGGDPAAIAEHLSRAGDPGAVVWSLHAALRASRLYAPYAVVQHLALSRESLESLEPQQQVEAYRLRGWAYEIRGEFDFALRDYLMLLQSATGAGDHHAHWDALMRLAQLWAGRDYDRTIEYIQQALALSEQIEDESLRARSLNRLGNWHLNGEDPDRARSYHQEALGIFQRLGDQAGAAETHDLLGMSSVMGGDLIGSTQHYERAVDLFQSLDNRQGLSSSLANLSMRGATYQTETMVASRTTLDDCVADAERALSIAEAIDWRAGEVYASIRLGFALGSRGDYQRAIDTARQSIERAEEIGHRQWLTAASCLAGNLYLDLLDPATARTHLERGRVVAEETGSRHWIRSTSALLASACLALGEIREAEGALRAALEDDPPPHTLAQRLTWCARIELELARGNPEEALGLADRVVAASPHASRERPPVRLAMLRADALHALGRYEQAESSLHPARIIAREQGARPALWRIQRDLGRIQTARGQRHAASGSFAEACRVIEELAANVVDPDTRSRYRAAAMKQIPETRAATALQAAKQTHGGLTRRQREVAALIANGCSNRVIADALSISERTVESHVTAILATLDLASRAHVAAWSVEHGLVANSRSQDIDRKSQ